MSIDTVRPCYAYSQNLTRCDLPGGHPGNHAITLEWDDADCYIPGIPTPTPTVTVTPLAQAQAVLAPADDQRNDPCVACRHSPAKHDPDGGCMQIMDIDGEQEPCSCKTFI